MSVNKSNISLVIEFGPKFCQAQFEGVVWNRVEYLDEERKNKMKIVNYLEESFSSSISEVVFDLTINEWISNEQIAFLFAWIKNVKEIGKRLKIKLPYRSNLLTSGIFNQQRMRELAKKYHDEDGNFYQESDVRIERRKQNSTFLMAIYGLYTELGLEHEVFENMAEYSTYNQEARMLKENVHQIIQFTTFDLSFNKQQLKFDTHFHDVINNNLNSQSKTGRVFDLQKEIQELLKSYACYSPFESKILSNVITQELYINSLQHSFDATYDEKRPNRIYS